MSLIEPGSWLHIGEKQCVFDSYHQSSWFQKPTNATEPPNFAPSIKNTPAVSPEQKAETSRWRRQKADEALTRLESNPPTTNEIAQALQDLGLINKPKKDPKLARDVETLLDISKPDPSTEENTENVASVLRGMFNS